LIGLNWLYPNMPTFAPAAQHTEVKAQGKMTESNETNPVKRRRSRRGGRGRRGRGNKGAAGNAIAQNGEVPGSVAELPEDSEVQREAAAHMAIPIDVPIAPVTVVEYPGASVPPLTSSDDSALQQESERRRRGRRRRGRGGRGRHDQNGSSAPAETAVQRSQPRPAPPRESDDSELESDEEIEIIPPSDEESSGERTMLINVAEGEECRIAILHQNRLEELFIERASSESHVGNIYKGRVTNVEPSIQAAFVDFGLPKNGFLHISDLQPQYFPDHRGQLEEVGRKTPRRDRPPIQRCLRRGQEVIVQIIKEGIGSKGPTLTTYISIPGRYLVMMPGMNRLGVSRKIEDEDARRKMRAILDELELPKDMGFILRTAGLDKTKRDLQRDQMYLQRLWRIVTDRIKNERAPCELYQESDLVIRTIRDIYSSDFGKIIVDDATVAKKVRDFLAIAMPRTSALVQLYTEHEPLFHKYGIEKEIERINVRHVPLPSGGSLVIDSTEALVAIDVNSGRFRDLDDAEETAFRINIEAAEEIARQLVLRDLGGLILCDFIDMRHEKHRRGVERALREALKKHKERAKCLRMSQFGIIEMTRQRMRPSIKRSIYQDCPHCRGSGLVKNPESMTLDIMRLLRLAAHHPQVETVEVRVAPVVAFQVQNRKRAMLHALEQETNRRIVIRADSNLGLDQYLFECYDQRGGSIRVIEPPDQPKSPSEMRSKRQQSSPGGELRFEGRETFEDIVD
jgi:Rne/Rng family ribonuclease